MNNDNSEGGKLAYMELGKNLTKSEREGGKNFLKLKSNNTFWPIYNDGDSPAAAGRNVWIHHYRDEYHLYKQMKIRMQLIWNRSTGSCPAFPFHSLQIG